MGYSMFFVIRFRKYIQNMKIKTKYEFLEEPIKVHPPQYNNKNLKKNIYIYIYICIHETCNMQIHHKHNKDTSNFLIPLLELVCYYVQYNYNEQLDFCLISKNTK